MDSKKEGAKRMWDARIPAWHSSTAANQRDEVPPMKRVELRALLLVVDPLPQGHAEMIGFPELKSYRGAAWRLLDKYYPDWRSVPFCERCERGELTIKSPAWSALRPVYQPGVPIRFEWQVLRTLACDNPDCTYEKEVKSDPE